MSEHFADRLLAAIEEKGSPVCVGIDPRPDRLPEGFRAAPGTLQEAEAVYSWCRELLEVVAPVVPAVKPQIAYFEALGAPGYAAYFQVVEDARRLGLVVIGDVKRNDIGATAEAYAAAHLAADRAPDAVTVNAYLGADGVRPFLNVCREKAKGVFLLVRTSNPSAGQVQDFTDSGGTKLYEMMGELTAAMGREEGMTGHRGYSAVGAVVGATWPGEAKKLREIMPHALFLVPGYGAQGATAEDCAASFREDGTGAIVNASRSVIYAHGRQEYAGMDWKQAVEAAAKAFAEDIARAVRA